MKEEIVAFLMVPPGLAVLGALIVAPQIVHVLDVERPDTPIHFEGMMRDVLWEGIDGDVKNELAALHPLAPNVKLLEMRGTSNADDTLFGYGVPLLGFIIGLFYAANVKPKQPKPEAAG